MVDPIKFGQIIKPLEDIHKSRTGDQQKVLYDIFKHTNEGLLREAVSHLVDISKSFPTPGDIKIALREASYNRAKQGNHGIAPRGCVHCHDGYVHYERDKNGRHIHYVGDCAYCHRGEISIQAQVVQKDNRIFDACELIKDGGIIRYRANPDMLEEYREASALEMDVDLKRRFENA